MSDFIWTKLSNIEIKDSLLYILAVSNTCVSSLSDS